MNCNEFKTYLETCVEQRTRPKIFHLREHIHECERCRELWAEFQVLEQALAEWEPPGDAPDLTARVLAEFAGETPSPASSLRPAPRRDRAAIIAMSLTACLLLAIFVPLVGSFFQSENTAPVAVTPDDSQAVPVAVAEQPDVRFDQLIGQTRGAYGLLFSEAKTSLGSLEQMIAIPEVTLLPNTQVKKSPATAVEDSQFSTLGQELRQSVGFLSAFYRAPDSGI